VETKQKHKTKITKWLALLTNVQEKYQQ